MFTSELTELLTLLRLQNSQAGLHPARANSVAVPQKRQRFKQVKRLMLLLQLTSQDVVVVNDQAHVRLSRRLLDLSRRVRFLGRAGMLVRERRLVNDEIGSQNGSGEPSQ
jgi:hypothetical protein